MEQPGRLRFAGCDDGIRTNLGLISVTRIVMNCRFKRLGHGLHEMVGAKRRGFLFQYAVYF